MIPEMKTFQNEISFSCQQFSTFQILMSSPGLYYTMNRRENRIVISKHNGHEDHLKKSYVKRRTVEVVRPNGSRKKVEIFVQAIEKGTLLKLTSAIPYALDIHFHKENSSISY